MGDGSTLIAVESEFVADADAADGSVTPRVETGGGADRAVAAVEGAVPDASGDGTGCDWVDLAVAAGDAGMRIVIADGLSFD